MITTSNHESGPAKVRLLIALVSTASAAVFLVVAPDAWDVIRGDFGAFATLATLAIVLQLMAVQIYGTDAQGRGSISVGGIGFLAVGFMFGAGPAMAAALASAGVNAVRRRSRPHRAAFNAATFALASGSAAALFHGLTGPDTSPLVQLVPAFLAGAVFHAVNVGLVMFAMSLAEDVGMQAIWQERFRWATAHYLSFGPLAVALTFAYEEVGLAGLLAFAVPPAIVIFSVQQYIDRTREAVEEVRAANAELAARNRDLRDLFEFAGGLAAHTHDRDELVEFAERALQTLVGGRISVTEESGLELRSGGERVGALLAEQGPGFDLARWERLRDAILPQLATALESAELVDRVKKTHLAMIAALSKSMEAKDYYTGGHTERVSEVALALARRLGFGGADLEAIEIGALLHDIGKIGIPERILHKPGPLDADEWKIMKEHPVISDYILSGVELDPVVRQIARSSHERIDGHGYPDGLYGDDIPLPARIVLVADAFDALTSDRPYRPGRSVEAALDELRAHSGTQFCSRVITALDELYREEPEVLLGPEVVETKVA